MGYTYEEYCKTFYNESELAWFIGTLIMIDDIDRDVNFSQRVKHFVEVQHFGSLSAWGFRYMGGVDNGVLFEWRNEEGDWAAGCRGYRCGCVVSDDDSKPYILRIYDDYLGEEYTEEVFEHAGKAVIRILEVIGAEYKRNGLAEIDEPRKYKPEEIINISDILDDEDDEDDDKYTKRNSQSFSDRVCSIITKTQRRYNKDKIKEILKPIRKMLYNMRYDYYEDIVDDEKTAQRYDECFRRIKKICGGRMPTEIKEMLESEFGIDDC